MAIGGFTRLGNSPTLAAFSLLTSDDQQVRYFIGGDRGCPSSRQVVTGIKNHGMV